MDKILHKAIEHYGTDVQLTVAIEELSELIKEICKNRRGNSNISELTEEVADCYIILEELLYIYDINTKALMTMIDYKKERLRRRMEESI